jgi:LL-diaminopimelate aminotransferase
MLEGSSMKISMAERMDAFGESVFAELSRLKKAKISAGEDVIDLSIGSPDLPPPLFIREAIAEGALDSTQYGYSLAGTESFCNAVSTYYQNNHSVYIDPVEQCSLLMGSQDGLVHLPLALCNPGDYILMPDPGYTAYAAGAALAGADIYPMPLTKEKQFLPDFSEIPEEIRKKARMMILNFPGNPVPGLANEAFFREAIEFARTYEIVILHDFAYSELYYEEKPVSFLAVEGAFETGIEMNSLSKSFNMAGCRIAYAAGNKDVIRMISDLKSHLDYGVFHPIQTAAARALADQSGFLAESREVYRKRRDALVESLREAGWDVDSPKGSMFVWAEIPNGISSREFSIRMLEEAGVAVTPGSAFGAAGEGFVRIALVQPEDRLRQAAQKISSSGILKKKSIV